MTTYSEPGGARPGWRGFGTRSILVVAALLVAAAVLAVAVYTTHPESIRPACSFPDGESYCAIARGEHGKRPFSRRVGTPAVAHVLPGSLDGQFRAIALVSLAISAVCSALLARRLARRMGVVDGRTLAATGTAAAAAVLIMPHGLRLALSVPILTDEAGLAVGLVWILLFTSKRAVVSTASLPAALLAVSPARYGRS